MNILRVIMIHTFLIQRSLKHPILRVGRRVALAGFDGEGHVVIQIHSRL